MKAHSETTFEVMHLLEEILEGFQDGHCRPANQIALYERYLELRQTYNAKLIRHLIVIDGTRPSDLNELKDTRAEIQKLLGKLESRDLEHPPGNISGNALPLALTNYITQVSALCSTAPDLPYYVM